MSDLKIVPAGSEYLARLVPFNAAMALATEHKVLAPAVLRAGIALTDPTPGHYVVALRHEEIVGALMLTMERSERRQTHRSDFSQTARCRADPRGIVRLANGLPKAATTGHIVWVGRSDCSVPAR